MEKIKRHYQTGLNLFLAALSLPSRTGVPLVFACPGRSGRGGTNGVEGQLE